jgi:hypothetical protein
VLKWSRARKQYERQGLLVEEQAIEQAEQECLADSEARAIRREREAARRAERLSSQSMPIKSTVVAWGVRQPPRLSMSKQCDWLSSRMSAMQKRTMMRFLREAMSGQRRGRRCRMPSLGPWIGGSIRVSRSGKQVT